jgi:hypothetical protein
MRAIDETLRRNLKARIYLYAVLPAVADLVKKSDRAKQIIGDREFSLRFQTNRGLRSTLQFAKQQCHSLTESKQTADIVLHYLTNGQLNKEFENDGFRVPIPIKGASRTRDIQAFKELSKELEQCLRPTAQQLEDTDFHNLHVELQLGIALRSVVQLAQYEPRSKSIIQSSPSGTAQFCILEEQYSAWVRRKDGELLAGHGEPAEPPEVTVTFNNSKTALKAIGNRIDVMAALGSGQIKVNGLIPLADAIGYIFERIPLYVTP